MEGPPRRLRNAQQQQQFSPDDDDGEEREEEGRGGAPTQLQTHHADTSLGSLHSEDHHQEASLDTAPFDLNPHDAHPTFASHDAYHLHHHHHHHQQEHELHHLHQVQPLRGAEEDEVHHQHLLLHHHQHQQQHDGEDPDLLAVRYHHGHEQVAHPALPFAALDGHDRPAPSLLGGQDESSLQHMLARHHFSHHHHHHDNGTTTSSSDDYTGACPGAIHAGADGKGTDGQQLHLPHQHHHQQLPLVLPVVSSLLPQPPRSMPAVDSQAAFHHHQHYHHHHQQLLEDHCHGGAEGDASGGDKRVDFRCTSSSEEKWERKFQELVEFKRVHHSFKPLKKTSRKLYWWVKDQRAFFREGRLPARRMDKLLEAGLFEGDTRTVSAKWDDVWEERFSELMSFKEQHGHTFVPNKSNPALYAWVRSQRLAKSKGRLSDSRKRRLDEIEFCWTGKQGEAPRRSGGGGKRQKIEDIVDDEQSGASQPPVMSTATLLPLPSQLFASLPTGVEGFDHRHHHHHHHLFLHQHAILVQQLQHAVAQQEGLGLTLPPSPSLKAEKSEGEVKDFLDLLSSQNKLFDIAEATTAVLGGDGAPPTTMTHDAHQCVSQSDCHMTRDSTIAAPSAAAAMAPPVDDRPASLPPPPPPPTHDHHDHHQQHVPTEEIARPMHLHHHHHGGHFS